ncbi:uncharacterized protein METZ01_LOCUS394094 [marine metagenome]|uniref:Uncharacterized protein n=1 Tax=marine metagenome TaxID=408172 RepID=A0A382V465_9ZZZZ
MGKSKIINELLWLRSFENEPIRVQESATTVPIKDFWYKESNQSIRDEIIDVIVQSIDSEEDNMSLITQDISQAFDAYLNIKTTQKSFKYWAYRTAVSILPKSTVSLIARLLKLMKIIENNSLISIYKLVSILQKDDIKVDIVALDQIVKIVLRFHLNKKDSATIGFFDTN